MGWARKGETMEGEPTLKDWEKMEGELFLKDCASGTQHCISLEKTDELSRVIRELQALRIMKSEPGRMKRIKDNIELLSILWFQS